MFGTPLGPDTNRMESFDSTSTTEQILWIPDISAEIKPMVAKIFESLEEVEKVYKIYARLAGFGVRSWTTRYDSKTGELCTKVFVCSKEGKTRPKKILEEKYECILGDKAEHEEDLEACSNLLGSTSDVKDGYKKRRRNHPILRENCKACIKVNKQNDGKWKVVTFLEGHSHELTTPRKTHLHRSHREVTLVQRRLINTFSEANIRTSQMYTIMEIEAGGQENVGYLEKDIRNIQTQEREEKKYCDAQLLIEHFLELKEINESFFYAYELDEENKLKHCFWADGLSRKNYHHYSDIMTFDTTYDTNMYSMIFAPFTGVNNHRQSVTFGCGFLRDEKIESFVWLFQRFLEAMFGVCPKSIITDQDPAMRAAIVLIFPTAYHRFCTWHILRKETNKLGATACKPTFQVPFHKCIWKSTSIEKFESEWETLMIENALQNNSWIQHLYEIRAKWVPIFSKEIFSAGIKSTQRSEAMNSFYSKYVSKQNTLMEFIIRFERAIKRQRNLELKQMYISEYTAPKLITPLNVEREMAKIYTREIFKRFQIELSKSLICFSSGVRVEESFQYSSVRLPKDEESGEVEYDILQRKAKCSCKKFESEGIPCYHLLYLLRMNEGDILSPHYVSCRWTISVVKQSVLDSNGKELIGDDGSRKHQSRNEIYSIVSSWVDKAYSSEENLAIAKKMLLDIGEKLEEMTLCTQDQSYEDNITRDVCILPPEKSKTKGSGKRIKGAKEIAIEEAAKGRLCNGCKKRGVDHDKRNCPSLRDDDKA